MTDQDRRRLAELCGLKLRDNEYWLKGVYLCTLKGWHPDESIEQVMMVAEAMREKCCRLELHSECLNAPLWFARFIGVLQSETEWEPGDTPAEAICAAALKAMKEADATKHNHPND